MNKWKMPPIIKIYEALGAVADGRVEIADEDNAKVWSSSGNKYYVVLWDRQQNAIMTNDNGTYWKDYLGYPAIAYLLKIGVLNYDEEMSSFLKEIPWKDINVANNNDFDKTVDQILISVLAKNGDTKKLSLYACEVLEQLSGLELNKLGKKIKPPSGY